MMGNSFSGNCGRNFPGIVVVVVVVLKSHWATVSLPLHSTFVSPEGHPGQCLRSPAGHGDESKVNTLRRGCKTEERARSRGHKVSQPTPCSTNTWRGSLVTRISAKDEKLFENL